MSQNNNVFKFDYDRRLFRKIKLFFTRLKWAWQRATKGYCDYDVYDLQSFYTKLFIASLRELAQKTDSFPDGISFTEWVNILNEAAQHMENGLNDAQEAQKGLELIKQWFYDLWW